MLLNTAWSAVFEDVWGKSEVERNEGGGGFRLQPRWAGWV